MVHWRMGGRTVALTAAILLGAAGLGLAQRPLEKLLPQGSEDLAWQVLEEPRIYTAETLYQYVDGAEQAYLTYGFKRVITTEVARSRQADQSVVVDIYDMGSPLNAFGMYSSERSPDYTYIDVGTQGYLGGGALNFWKGSYYVKLVAFEETEETKDLLQTVAREIEANIAETSSPPAFLKLFPREDQVTNTAQYIPKNVLGHSFLRNGYFVRYRVDASTWTAFLLDLSDAEESGNAFAQLRRFYGERRGKTDIGEDVGTEAFRTSSRMYGTVVVFRKGRIVGGTLGAPESLTTPFVQRMLGRLPPG